MAYDTVKFLKLETPAEGGTQTDLTPTESNPFQDAPILPAVYVQNTAGTTADKIAYLDRNANDLRLTDTNAGTKNVQDLVSRVLGAVAAHQSLPDMAHFIGAPADGWATPYYTEAYTGPFLMTATWWTTSSQTRAIFRQSYTYSGPFIAQIVNTVYDATGAQVRQVTDLYTYNGPILASIARSWT